MEISIKLDNFPRRGKKRKNSKDDHDHAKIKV
jgi:hypothetical protein